MEQSLWQEYQDEGVVVWGIGADDPEEVLNTFREEMGITFPILVDPTGDVHDSYSQQTAFGGTLYPQDWIIGVDGRVAYINNGYDPEAMKAILDAELAKR